MANAFILKNSRGQGLIEYIILVALIATVSIIATRNLGKKVKGRLEDINRSISERVVVPNDDE